MSYGNCKRCQETPVPSYYGSPRRCAFDFNGDFTANNWNCESANLLRSMAHERGDDESMKVRRDDSSYASIWIPWNAIDDTKDPFQGGGFISMMWYKGHGCTDVMWRVDTGKPLTSDEIEAALVNLELAGKMVSEDA